MLLILSTLTAVEALADSCSTVDLRPKLGAPRDQGETGWCFANTAADLLSVKMGKRISAHDLAISHHLLDLNKVENSDSPAVREHLRANNLMKRMRDERIGEDTDPSEPYLRRTNFLRYSVKNEETTHHGLLGMGGSEDIAILTGQERGFCLAKNLEGATPNDQQFTRKLLAYHKRNGLPLSSTFQDHGGATDPETQRMAQSVLSFTDQKCGQRLMPREKFTPYARIFGKSADDFRRQTALGRIDKKEAQSSVWGDIDSLLEKGEASTIGYDAYDLMTRSPEEKDEHGDHSSVIAGRKMINGTCHYFLRNSWGADCSIYSGKFEKRCKPTEASGGLWIKKEELPSLYSVVSLSRPATAEASTTEPPSSDGRD